LQIAADAFGMSAVNAQTEVRETTKIQCLACDGSTNHDVVASHKSHFGSDEMGIDVWNGYEIAVCRGCGSVSFVHTSACSEDFDPNTGEISSSVTLYPDRLSGRKQIHGDENFPAKTRRIYSEVIKAMNSSSPLLAAIGLRALIESICLDQAAKGKNLKARISALAALGLLSQRQADILHNHRFMGNKAAHEMEAAPPQELVAALEIAETLLKTIYLLPVLGAKITAGKVKPSSSTKTAWPPPVQLQASKKT